MNKLKNTLVKAIILVLCILVCFASAAFAADKYEYSQITYTDGSGAPVYSLAGGTLNASVTVKMAEGESPESMALLILLYKDGKLTDAGIDEKEAQNTDTPYNVSITVPAETENCWVNTILWNSVSGMTPICNSSIMPGGSNDIVSLKVDGELIEGFTPETLEYEYVVESTRTLMPKVEATTLDAGAKVEIINPTNFPGKTDIKVTSIDGVEKIYSIKYKTSEPLIKNLKYIPVFTSAVPELKLQSNLQIGSDIVSDRDGYLATEVLEELVGADYIMTAFGWGNNKDTLDYVEKWKSSEATDWLSFDLTRSATVHVLCVGSPGVFSQDASYSAETGGVVISNTSFTKRYVRRYEVGEEPVTVTSPNIVHNRGYVHVIVFDGYETEE